MEYDFWFVLHLQNSAVFVVVGQFSLSLFILFYFF